MAESAVAAVLSKFGELAAREAKVLLDVRDDMMLLRDRLEWLQAFIRDADRRRRSGTDDGLTSVWVRQTRDVAFQAEDALDEFFYQDDLKNLGYRGWKLWSKYVTSFWTQIIVRHALSDRITRIKSRLKQITESQKEYKLEHTPSVKMTSSTTATAAWRDGYKNAVGFDNDVKILKKMLQPGKGGHQLMFISIFGDSGVGKSTLADIIYHKKMMRMFNVKIRVKMPSDCNTESLLQEIYAIAQDRTKEKNADYCLLDERIDISLKIRRLLATKRYLVMILGGIPSKAMLNCVRASLPEDTNGSRVMLILDTENEEVAWHANNMNKKGVNGIHRLSRLNKEKTGELFRSRAFRKEISDGKEKLPGGEEEVLPDGKENKKKYGKKSLRKEVSDGKEELPDGTEEQSDGKENRKKYDKRPFRKEPSDGKEALPDGTEEMSDGKEELSDGKEELSDGNENNKYDKIVYDITGGYPLAIVVLAGLLRFKEKQGQWDAVLQQLRSGPEMEEAGDAEADMITGAVLSKDTRVEWQISLATHTNLSRLTVIERVFWASFEDLPYDLKSCLLYFAAFPNNVFLNANTIVAMWMAEGFIKPQKGKTMEEVGHDYLKELVLRCLVQVVSMNDLSSIWEVSVHKSLQGFLRSEAHEAGFLAVHDMYHVFVAPSVRRLSFLTFGGRYIAFSRKFPKLRSFICWVEEQDWSDDHRVHVNPCHNIKFLQGSKFIRVISVWGLSIQKLPDEIGDMIHLRYLSVDSKNLKELPSSIKKLLNLQTLDIRGTRVNQIDPCFWNIKGLRHVLAKGLMLPESIEEELDELQTLIGVKLMQRTNCPLDKMKKLRTLKLHGIEHTYHEAALEEALMKMDLLVDLYLQGDMIPKCVFTAEILRYLESIELVGTVQWPDVALEVRTVRPNLVQLRLTDGNDAPQHIKDELEKIGFNRSASQPVYRLSYKQGERVAPKPNGGEASSSGVVKKQKKKKNQLQQKGTVAPKLRKSERNSSTKVKEAQE